MKLIIERADALATLSRVTGVVARNSNVPILNNVLITASDDGRVTFRATDLDMEATASCAAQVSIPGVLTVDAGKLREVVASVAAGSEISMELDESDDPRLVVKSGRSRFKLPVIGAYSFPSIPDEKWAATFTVPAEVFADTLNRTVFAVGSDMAMPALHGVFLEIDGKDMIAVATNRYRVSRIINTAPKGSEKMPPVILPSKFVAQVVKASGETGDLTVSVAKNKVRVTTEGGSLVGKTIDYDYVDYRRLIPGDHELIARVDIQALTAAVRRAAIAGDTDKNGTGVRLSFASGVLTIIGRNPDGEAMDEIEIDYDGPEIAIGAGYQYIVDALANIEGETACLGFGEKAPLIAIWSETDDASLQLVGKRLVAK
mgnify:CR=1 FL=1